MAGLEDTAALGSSGVARHDGYFDCNNNGISDDDELNDGAYRDSDGVGILDVCNRLPGDLNLDSFECEDGTRTDEDSIDRRG